MDKFGNAPLGLCTVFILNKIIANDTIILRITPMSFAERLPGEGEKHTSFNDGDFEAQENYCADFSGGMEDVTFPPYINMENCETVFGPTPPEGLIDILKEGGSLELSQ